MTNPSYQTERKHSPLPWKVLEGRNNLRIVSEPFKLNATGSFHRSVCYFPNLKHSKHGHLIKTNADFICTAINLHDQLVAALEEIMTTLENVGYGGSDKKREEKAIKKIESLLHAARGEK